MLFHEFGQENKDIIVMIHGLTMTWDMFGEVINRLQKEYHLIAVAVPGHDLETNEDFTSVEEIANRIEDELLAQGYHEIKCLYGLSMGGGIAIRMLADNRIHFQNAIIDAGITPYQLPYIQTRLILLLDFGSTMLARKFPSLLKLVFPPERFGLKLLEKEIKGIKHLSAKTIWRAYDSTDNYSMPKQFPKLDTHIEYWYGEDEAKDRKLDLQYVKQTIPNVRFRRIPGMMHGQFVCANEEKFCRKIKAVLEK